jgi:hypothetical protein
MEVSDQLHAQAALPSRVGGPQSRSGRSGEEKNSQTLSGLKPPIIQPLRPEIYH